MKNTITKLKSSLEEVKNRVDETQERNRKLKTGHLKLSSKRRKKEWEKWRMPKPYVVNQLDEYTHFGNLRREKKGRKTYLKK